jgi:hypothetical protein
MESGATPSPIASDIQPIAYTVPATDDTFSVDDLCSDAMSTETTNQCAAAKAQTDVASCCSTIGGTYCDDLETDCRIDACIGADGDISAIAAQVQELFTDPITSECATDFATVYVQENYAVFQTGHPTSEPSRAPTANTNNPSKSPSESPTVLTTNPTIDPTADPTSDPTNDPTSDPRKVSKTKNSGK